MQKDLGKPDVTVGHVIEKPETNRLVRIEIFREQFDPLEHCGLFFI
jgi:hypothetical protein